MTPSQRYREKHKERLNAAAKQWREDNRERFLATHRSMRHTDEYKQREKARAIASRRSTPLKFSLQKARRRARENGWDFDLDLQHLQSIWTGVCPIFNVPLTMGNEVGTVSEVNMGSLDRLDSTKGYVRGNVHFISFRANNIKTDATFQEFEQIYNWWRTTNEQR